MFDNIGAKIKTAAKIFCLIGIFFSIIGSFGLMVFSVGNTTVPNVLLAILMAALGSLLSWLGSFGIYGFGELVENSDIRTNLAIKADAEREQRKNTNGEAY